MKNINILMAIVFLAGAMLFAGCNTVSDTPPDAPAAKSGDTVSVDYTGKLSDGTVFDTSADREPLEFTLGQGEMMPAFERAIVGMKAGQKKTFTVAAEEAYGSYYEERVVVFSRTEIPKDITPQVGMMLQQTQEDGSVITATIIEVTDETVTLDANHPLAGKDLTFEIELLNISKGN
jgi:peptidylprolyl isomerase